MAQFSSQLLSAEIPLFPGATGAQFSDNPAQLFFDSGKSMDEVVVPTDAKEVKVKRDSIEFQLAAGQARKIVEGWQRQYTKAGWKEQTSVLQDLAGAVVLTHGSNTLTIVYTDVGFMPAELSIDATGIKLQRARKIAIDGGYDGIEPFECDEILCWNIQEIDRGGGGSPRPFR